VRTKAGCNCQDRKKACHREGGGLFVLNATLTSLTSIILEKIVDLTGLDHLTPWCKTTGGARHFASQDLCLHPPARLLSLPSATVADSVAARTSGFTRIQYQWGSRLLKTQELRGAVLGREPAAKQIVAIVETC
jgi:hypothetical protein